MGGRARVVHSCQTLLLLAGTREERGHVRVGQPPMDAICATRTDLHRERLVAGHVLTGPPVVRHIRAQVHAACEAVHRPFSAPLGVPAIDTHARDFGSVEDGLRLGGDLDVALEAHTVLDLELLGANPLDELHQLRSKITHLTGTITVPVFVQGRMPIVEQRCRQMEMLLPVAELELFGSVRAIGRIHTRLGHD